jgi:hypothetical protein
MHTFISGTRTETDLSGQQRSMQEEGMQRRAVHHHTTELRSKLGRREGGIQLDGGARCRAVLPDGGASAKLLYRVAYLDLVKPSAHTPMPAPSHDGRSLCRPTIFNQLLPVACTEHGRLLTTPCSERSLFERIRTKMFATYVGTPKVDLKVARAVIVNENEGEG